MTEVEVDARNLLCPMPVIRTQNAVKNLEPGNRVRVLCTDPGAMADIPAWCRINGHTLISAEEVDDLITIVVEVAPE